MTWAYPRAAHRISERMPNDVLPPPAAAGHTTTVALAMAHQLFSSQAGVETNNVYLGPLHLNHKEVKCIVVAKSLAFSLSPTSYQLCKLFSASVFSSIK